MGAGSIRVMLGVIKKQGISFAEVHRITNQIVEIDGKDRWDMDLITREIRKGISKAIEISPENRQQWNINYVMLIARQYACKWKTVNLGLVVGDLPKLFTDFLTDGFTNI